MKLNLRGQFLLIILSITTICVVGVSIISTNNLVDFWREETERKIQENSINFQTNFNRLVTTVDASATTISKDNLTARYYSLSEDDRFMLLSPTITRYLNNQLLAYPFYQEIVFLNRDGFEEARAASGIENKNDYEKSPLVEKAWLNPDEIFMDLEYHEDFSSYSLNVYRAITIIDRSISYDELTVKGVIKISINENYVISSRGKTEEKSAGFFAIHDGQGNVVIKSTQPIPKSLITKLTDTKKIRLKIGSTPNDLIFINTPLFSQWQLIVGISSKKAFDAIRAISLRSIFIHLLFFMILSSSVYLLLSRVVVTPINKLIKAIDQFSRSGKAPELPHPNNELGDLQDAFLAMVNTVTGHTRSLKKQIETDHLTGLPNRNSLQSLLNISIAEAKSEDRKFAVMFIDLDGFKQVNDVLGHDMGDELLKTVSKQLIESVRSIDAFGQKILNTDTMKQTVVRLGGDEFTIVLQDARDESAIEIVAQKILNIFSQEILLGENRVFVGASIGISVYPDDAENPKDLLKYADTAMYRSKELGKMRYTFFHKNMFENDRNRLSIRHALHDAIKNNEFWVSYQAKVNPKTYKVVGFEALARLTTIDLGNVSPIDFIRVAEQSGIADDFTRRIVKQSCEHIVYLRNKTQRWFSISINISPQQLSNKRLCIELAEIVKDNMIPTHLIEFEITENSLLEKEDLAEQNINELRRQGLGIALDDFGVGFSSLDYLRRYRFDTLKIDRVFFHKIEEDQFARKVLTGIVKLAHTLEMSIVAEGVETETQLQFVIENPIDSVQGYIFSKPVRAEEVLDEIFRIEKSSSKTD